MDFGTTAYGIREIAQRVPDRPRILSTVTYLRLLTAVTGGSLCAAAIATPPSLAEYRAAMLIACIYFITYGMTQEWFYAGSLMFRPIALSNLVRGATCLLSPGFARQIGKGYQSCGPYICRDSGCFGTLPAHFTRSSCFD